jgi:hypothetical protein
MGVVSKVSTNSLVWEDGEILKKVFSTSADSKLKKALAFGGSWHIVRKSNALLVGH